MKKHWVCFSGNVTVSFLDIYLKFWCNWKVLRGRSAVGTNSVPPRSPRSIAPTPFLAESTPAPAEVVPLSLKGPLSASSLSPVAAWSQLRCLRYRMSPKPRLPSLKSRENRTSEPTVEDSNILRAILLPRHTLTERPLKASGFVPGPLSPLCTGHSGDLG